MGASLNGACRRLMSIDNRTLRLNVTLNVSLQENTVCLDFTLDSGNVSLIQRRSVNQKLRKRLCCCVLLLLAVGVVIVVVVGISLYLTHGQKYFGSI